MFNFGKSEQNVTEHRNCTGFVIAFLQNMKSNKK